MALTRTVYKVLFFSLLIVSFLLLIPNAVYATEFTSDNNTDTTGNGDYAITKYNIDVLVNENNTFNITENIRAFFNVDKHGIFRKIPLRNEVVRLDGTKSYNR